MFTFRRADRSKYQGGSNIRNVGNSSQQAAVLFPGQAIALFGQPDQFTDDYEDIFSMVVSAEREGCEPVYLEIYQGPSGPAIGGDCHSIEANAAAKELAQLLLAAKPADYDWEGDYADIPVHIKMGVKNGVPYHEDDMAENFDPEDLM